MKVRHDEGVANHIGPEPCVAVRKDVDEASVGEGIGQPLSHEIDKFRCADAVSKAEGNTAKHEIARLGGPAGSKNLACVEAPWAGTGRSQVWPFANALVRIGKARSRSQ